MIVTDRPLSVAEWRERLAGTPDGTTVVMPRRALLDLLDAIDVAEAELVRYRQGRPSSPYSYGGLQNYIAPRDGAT